MSTAQVARIVHEANRAYCQSTGDHSQPPWAQAPDWQKSSAMQGVDAILEGRVTRPEQSHESWLAEKTRDGWKYGPVKDPVTKKHPCFVPYPDLPLAQRLKDVIFFAIVRAILDALTATAQPQKTGSTETTEKGTA